MNISHINFLGFIGGIEPLPPRRRTRRVEDKYPLYPAKKTAAAHAPRPRDISERFLLGGLPVVAPPAHFFRAFGALKNQKSSPVKSNYAEVRP